MFNRRLMIFIALWALIVGMLWWSWQSPQGVSLHTGVNPVSSTRLSQDLNGDWNRYSSIRQAWTTESEQTKGKIEQFFFTGGRPIILPSSEKISVVAKRFRIPPEWSSRTMLLTLNGVVGHADVYLNGITSTQKVGEFEGSGGPDTVTIPAQEFLYGAENILMVELSGGMGQRSMVLGSSWPNSGQITGNILLEGVVKTTIHTLQMSVNWEGNTAQVTVNFTVMHHGVTQDGPWTVDGVLSDGSAGVAAQSLIVQPQADTDFQVISMNFTVADARRWNLDSPFLYQLHLTVSNTQGDRDDLAMSLGLRSMGLSSGKWFLNDQVITIKGEALTPTMESEIRHSGQVKEWLTTQREKGINLIYMIGQIPDDLWLQEADQIGIGLWAELPVELVPSRRLPQPEIFREMVNEKMLHPSLWAWTVNKGLYSDSLTKTYLQGVSQEVQQSIAFALTTKPGVLSGLPSEQTILIQGDKIIGPWGQVEVEAPLQSEILWTRESIAAMVFAFLMVFLAGMNIRSVTWRYIELSEKKPKRRLRSAWFWDGLMVVARQGLLAGLVTSGLLRIPIHLNPWFSNLWPGVELIQAQSPWLIWSFLCVFFLLIRLIHVGVVAPHLPDSPNVIGLVYWLERRYLLAVFIAIGWALVPYGVPLFAPVLGYLLFVLFLLPVRVRDIRRIGGRYRYFLWVPGLMFGLLLLWTALHIVDWIYLWHILKL